MSPKMSPVARNVEPVCKKLNVCIVFDNDAGSEILRFTNNVDDRASPALTERALLAVSSRLDFLRECFSNRKGELKSLLHSNKYVHSLFIIQETPKFVFVLAVAWAPIEWEKCHRSSSSGSWHESYCSGWFLVWKISSNFIVFRTSTEEEVSCHNIGIIRPCWSQCMIFECASALLCFT